MGPHGGNHIHESNLVRDQAGPSRLSFLDIFKGLLVIIMLLDHVVKTNYPVNTFGLNVITWVGDLSVFPGLLLSFGYVAQRVYFSDLDQIPTARILKTIARIFIAYFISAIMYRFIVDPGTMDLGILPGIITFADIPSYSEFFVTFGISLLIAFILVRPLDFIVSSRYTFLIIIAIILLSTFLPSEHIVSSQLGLLLGTREFTTFPVLQYSVFFLIGMRFAVRGHARDRWFILAGIGLLSLTFFRFAVGPPERFPPSLVWILGSFSFAYTIYLIAHRIDRSRYPTGVFEFYGRHALATLLLSNLVLFIMMAKTPPWLPPPWILLGISVVVIFTAASVLPSLSTSLGNFSSLLRSNCPKNPPQCSAN